MEGWTVSEGRMREQSTGELVHVFYCLLTSIELMDEKEYAMLCCLVSPLFFAQLYSNLCIAGWR